MNVLGISGLPYSVPFKRREFPNLPAPLYHTAQGADAAAALVTSRGVVAAAAEERFNGEKSTHDFPVNAIRFCLEEGKLSLDDVDFLAHGFSYDACEDLYRGSDLDRRRFLEVYARAAQIRCLAEHFPGHDWDSRFVAVPHHLAHAASAFYPSGFPEALILIADAMGEVHSTTLAVGRAGRIDAVRQIPANHSLGILYGVITLHLGFCMGIDEYKIMGLAPYGDPHRYYAQFMQWLSLKDDGTYTIPMLFNDRTVEEKETYGGVMREVAEALGPARDPRSEITQRDMDIAAGLQMALQTGLMHVLRHFRRETGQANLCMAGGVALNCTANGVIWRSRMFRNVFVQPAAGDDGTSLGAALYVQHSREPEVVSARMGLPLWGPSFEDEEIERGLQGLEGCVVFRLDRIEDLVDEVTMRLARGEILGWFQGRMEFGPRALGSRSILADPRRADMRDRINARVKKRESFRPFAPAVTAEAASTYFEMEPEDHPLYAHMLFVTRVRPEFRDRLPAVTHVDGSARVQTVSRDSDPRFWAVLMRFGEISGLPVLVNTSFNVRGQPIVRTPKEGIETFLSARLDALAIGNFMVARGGSAGVVVQPGNG